MKLLNDKEKLQNENSILMPLLATCKGGLESDYKQIARGDLMGVRTAEKYFAENFEPCEEDSDIRDCMQTIHNHMCKLIGIKPCEVVLYLDAKENDDYFGDYNVRNGKIEYNIGNFGQYQRSILGITTFVNLARLTIEKAQADNMYNFIHNYKSMSPLEQITNNYNIIMKCNQLFQKKNNVSMPKKENSLSNLDFVNKFATIMNDIVNPNLKSQAKPILEDELQSVKSLTSYNFAIDVLKNYQYEVRQFNFCFDGNVSNKLQLIANNVDFNRVGNEILKEVDSIKTLETVIKTEPESVR